MKVAVLPFNAAKDVLPARARQLASFIGDNLRKMSDLEVGSISYVTQVQQDGTQKAAFVNVSDQLLEDEWIQQIFSTSDFDAVIDGLVGQNDGSLELTVRINKKASEEPLLLETKEFPTSDTFKTLEWALSEIAGKLDADLKLDSLEFGTSDAEAFLRFLDGFDALAYLQQSGGRVAKEFSPQPAIEALQFAVNKDPDFLTAYEVLVQLIRVCGQLQIGKFDEHEKVLNELIEKEPEDFRAVFALAELYQNAGDLTKATELFERAIQVEPDEPNLYVRLGLVQMSAGMPVNAERNFRKAIELEGDEPKSVDYLASVLQQTGRAHEVPELWKEVITKIPTDGQAHAKYAISLAQADKKEEAIAAFEKALEQVDDAIFVKRYYAPVLAQTGDVDRAMDFYEDCLDEAPNDIELMLEYARTLHLAGRSFEIPNILNNILASNPDPNTRAQTLAWLIELEQPKRVEVVEKAREKMQAGDFESAVRDMKPLRNWLADYWKMWALFSSAYNHLDEPEEAEDAARRLLDLFPGCEPVYGELLTSLGKQGRHDEAYALMKYASSQMPQSLPVHINLALAAKRAGHKEEASDIADKIRKSVKDNAEIEKILAEIDS